MAKKLKTRWPVSRRVKTGKNSRRVSKLCVGTVTEKLTFIKSNS
jgi:hypothetical protein